MRPTFENVKYIIFRIFRIIGYYFLLMVFVAFSESVLKRSMYTALGFPLGPIFCTVFELLFFVVALYTLTRTFALHDTVCLVKYDQKRGLLSFLYRWEFWFFLSGILVAMFLVPFSPAPVRLILKDKASSPLGSLLFALILLPFFFLSHLSAEKRRRSVKKFAKEQGSGGALISKLLFLTFLFFAACVMVPFIFAMFLTGFTLLASGGAKAILAVFAILLLIILPLYIRAWRKRRKFLSSLKELVEKKGYSLSAIRFPFLSLFKNVKGVSFTVEANGKKYACKLYSSVNRNNAVILSGEGCGVRKFSFYFMKSHFSILGAHVFSAELFALSFHFNYDFEAEGQKVLIFTNVPRRMLYAEGDRVSLLDNGDLVDGYKIFSGSAFLAGLERDTLERRMNE